MVVPAPPPVNPCDPSVTNPHLKRECAARTWAGTLGNWKPTREQQRFMLKECNQTISNYDLAVRCTEIRRLLANKPPTKPTKQEIAEADALAVAGQRQARRDQLAVAQCEYRSQVAFDRSPGLLMPFANANNARTQCLEFYQRNGALPGDPLD